MLSVIKTAIITIIISFISGVLLDNYKNLAPKILCTMGKGVPLKFNNKKIKAYNLNIRNMSNKTIHDLNINIQGHYDKLRVEDAKITKGLKFKLSGEDNNYNVSIPFLSRNDEFSVKVFVADNMETNNKPIVTLRSPENFKKVYSTNKNGYLASILNIPKDISEHVSSQKNSDRKTRNNKLNHNAEKSFFSNKKVIITIASILLISYFGILGGEYYMKVAAKMKNSAEKESAVNTPDTSSSTSSTLNKETQKETSTSSNENTSNKQASKNAESNNSEKNTSASSNSKSTKVTNEESNQNNQPSDKSTPSNNSANKSKENTNKNVENNKEPQNNNNNKSEEDNNSQNNKNNINADKSLNSANKNAKTSQSQNVNTSNQNGGSTNTNNSEQNKN